MKALRIPPERGFTLIELLVTVMIAAVLLLVAVPSMTAYKRNAELTSATNTLLAAINAARGEAMKRGMYAMVVPVDGANWNSGWIVFVDRDRSRTYSPAGDLLVMSQLPLAAYFNVSGNGSATGLTPYVLFDASGYSKMKDNSFSNLTLTLARTDVSGATQIEQTRRIVIGKTGRTRSCRPSADTSCGLNATD